MMFLLLIVYFLFFYLIGKTIIGFSDITIKNQFNSVFTASTIGFFISISVYATLKTNGISVLSLLLISIIIWLILSRQTNFIKIKHFTFEWKELIEVFCLATFIFLINYWKYIGNESVNVINWDAMSDVTRAIFLNFTGVENSNTNYIQIPSGSQPYHYFEAWSVAFFANIFNTNFWLAQGLIFQPIILGIVYSGFRSLSGKKAGNFSAILFGIFLLFGSGFLTESIRNIQFFEWTIPLRNNIIDEPWWTRMSVLYPIIIIAVHFVKVNDYKNSLFVLLLIPFLSVTPAIPIISACFATVVFVLLFFKNHNLKWIHLFAPVAVAISYKLFYTFFIDKSNFIPLPTGLNIIQELTQGAVLKSKIVMMAEKIIQSAILYSPIWILILIGLIINKTFTLNIKKWEQNTKISVFFIAFISLFSLAMWQVLNFVFGASFFYYYTMIPFFNILLVYVLWQVFNQAKYKALYIICVLGFLSFYFYRSFEIHQSAKKSYFSEHYDINFVKGVQKIWDEKVTDNGLSLGVKMENHSEIIHPYFNDGISLCGHYIYGIANAPALISLSRADLPTEKLFSTPYSESFTKNTSFYQYAKANSKIKDLNEIKLKFIQQYKIKYGIVSPKGEIPPTFATIIDTVLTDKKSGERFILFKPL